MLLSYSKLDQIQIPLPLIIIDSISSHSIAALISFVDIWTFALYISWHGLVAHNSTHLCHSCHVSYLYLCFSNSFVVFFFILLFLPSFFFFNIAHTFCFVFWYLYAIPETDTARINLPFICQSVCHVSCWFYKGILQKCCCFCAMKQMLKKTPSYLFSVNHWFEQKLSMVSSLSSFHPSKAFPHGCCLKLLILLISTILGLFLSSIFSYGLLKVVAAQMQVYIYWCWVQSYFLFTVHAPSWPPAKTCSCTDTVFVSIFARAILSST